MNNAGIDPGYALCYPSKFCDIASISEIFQEPVAYVVWYIEGIQDLGKGIMPYVVEYFGIVCGDDHNEVVALLCGAGIIVINRLIIDRGKIMAKESKQSF